MLERDQTIVDHQVRLWATAACHQWGFDEPSEQFFKIINQRLPAGLLETIKFGIEKGIVIPDGCTFRIKGLKGTKGPYNWFSRDNVNHRPNPNWEYYIHVAEYVRLSQAFQTGTHVLTFEDTRMDIGVYQDNHLMVCCEIKEKSSQAKNLIAGIKRYEPYVDRTTTDKGNDPLQKAKYILHLRPLFFYVVAIGVRYEFAVSFPEGKAFELREDIIPFVDAFKLER